VTSRYRTVGYRDELLADRSVRRAYADGRQEWRRREPGGVVSWRDDRGRSGTDEMLGRRILKRTVHSGAGRPDTVVYGRELGYGRTSWSDGVLTANETSLGGRVAAVIAAAGAAGLLMVADPPMALSAEEEEELRRQAQQSTGGDGDSGGDVSWSSSDDSGSDFGDDFG
jgi:hypothetical protein